MKLYTVCLVFTFLQFYVMLSAINTECMYVVDVPVVSIMSRPAGIPTPADDIAVFSRFNRLMRGQMFTIPVEQRNPLRCTQLLRGDLVRVLQKNGSWYLVRSSEQYIYAKDIKTYIEGWVPVYAIKQQQEKSQRLISHAIGHNEQAARKKIISFMRHAIGNSYVWGGRSLGKRKVHGEVVGPDCSGLVGLAYKKAGMSIPRNAQSMRHEARVVRCGADLQAGDLIFFAHPDNKNSITHVVAYSGNDSVIESKVPEGVVETACKKRFGMSMRDMRSGELYMKPARRLYFGTFFNT